MWRYPNTWVARVRAWVDASAMPWKSVIRISVPILLTWWVVLAFAPSIPNGPASGTELTLKGMTETQVRGNGRWIRAELRPGERVQLETRFDWPSLDASAPLLEIARITGSFELRLNDLLITRKVPESPWLVARERHSRYLLSQGALKPTDNRLLFTFYSGRFQTSIELEGLKLRASGQNDYSSTDKRDFFALFNAAGAATLSALLFGIFSQRRKDPEYLYFATGILAWGAYNFIFALDVYVLSPKLTQLMLHSALAIFVWGMSLFARRYCAERNPSRERLVHYLTVSSILLLLMATLLLPVNQIYGWPMTLHRLVLALIGLDMSLVFLRYCWRVRAPASDLLTGAQLGALSLGVHDALYFGSSLDLGYGALIGFGLPVPLFIFGYILAQRFTQSLAQAETLNRDLDQRVQAKSAELEGAYAERAQLIKAQTLSAERERLMRDVHDGVGGQLVSLLAQTDRGQLHVGNFREALDASLTDLRFIIDSLDEVGSDPLIALGMFRQRVQPQITRAGLQASFNTNTLPEGLTLPPETLLQCFRILQEAIQNTLKHALASRVTIAASCFQSELHVSVRDDGIGGAKAQGGRGLRNMAARAQQIGARLVITSDSGGTCVSLTLALSSR